MRRVILGIVLLGFPLVAGCLITDSIRVPHGGSHTSPEFDQYNPPYASVIQMTYDSTPRTFFAFATEPGGTPADQIRYQWILDGEFLNAPQTGLNFKVVSGAQLGPGGHELSIFAYDTDPDHLPGYIIWQIDVQ